MRLIPLLLLAGCAHELTDVERYEMLNRRQIEAELWDICRQHLRFEVHYEHDYDHRRALHSDIKSDLINNNCYMLIKDSWR